MDPTPKTPKPKSQILLPILFGTLLLALGIIVGVLMGKHYSTTFLPVTLSPTPVYKISTPAFDPDVGPNPSWKTYTDTKFGFSLSYPLDVAVVEDGPVAFKREVGSDIEKSFREFFGYTPPKTLTAISTKDLSFEVPRSGGLEHMPEYSAREFNLWILNNPDKFSIDKWHERYSYFPFTLEKGNNSLKRPVYIDGQLAYYWIIGNYGSNQSILLSKKEKMYIFNISGERKDNTIGNQILSTLKFTD